MKNLEGALQGRQILHLRSGKMLLMKIARSACGLPAITGRWGSDAAQPGSALLVVREAVKLATQLLDLLPEAFELVPRWRPLAGVSGGFAP